MAASCFGVSGRASGSLFAAAVTALSSSVVGILTEGRLVTLDIVFYLTTIGAAQADDPSHFASINKANAVQDPGSRYERDHARLAVFEPAVDACQGTSRSILREAERMKGTSATRSGCWLHGIEVPRLSFARR